MKTIKLYICFVLAFICLSGCKKSEAQPKPVPANNFRVVGYLFNTGNLSAEIAQVDFSRITHLNIAFINPDASGNFSVSADLDNMIKKAHENNVKVLYSLGGGDPPAHLLPLLEADKRASFIANLTELAVKHNFDGVDVDLEGSFINANYEAFVTELAAQDKAHNKLLTAAVATWNSYSISDKALSLYDFINVMSYDKTGPWNPSKAGEHSPYSMAVDDIQHWNAQRSVPADKISLGLPFYGYGFGPDIAESMTYKDIVTTYPGAENVDLVDIPGKGTIYYNGIPTIKKKVGLAFDKQIGGVMIWQLLGDTNDSKSLLKSISNVINERSDETN